MARRSVIRPDAQRAGHKDHSFPLILPTAPTFLLTDLAGMLTSNQCSSCMRLARRHEHSFRFRMLNTGSNVSGPRLAGSHIIRYRPPRSVKAAGCFFYLLGPQMYAPWSAVTKSRLNVACEKRKVNARSRTLTATKQVVRVGFSPLPARHLLRTVSVLEGGKGGVQ